MCTHACRDPKPTLTALGAPVPLQLENFTPFFKVWFDWDDAFRGFDMTTFVLTVLPVVLKIPVFQASVFMVGAVKTSMAVSFEIGLSYLLEVVFSLAEFCHEQNACHGNVGMRSVDVGLAPFTPPRGSC